VVEWRDGSDDIDEDDLHILSGAVTRVNPHAVDLYHAFGWHKVAMTQHDITLPLGILACLWPKLR
jgi:hypothetical protein